MDNTPRQELPHAQRVTLRRFRDRLRMFVDAVALQHLRLEITRYGMPYVILSPAPVSPLEGRAQIEPGVPEVVPGTLSIDPRAENSEKNSEKTQPKPRIRARSATKPRRPNRETPWKS